MTIPAIDPISIGVRTDASPTSPTSRAAEPFDALMRPAAPAVPADSSSPSANQRGTATGETRTSASPSNSNTAAPPAEKATASEAPAASADHATPAESGEERAEATTEESAVPATNAEQTEETRDEELGDTTLADDSAIDSIAVSASAAPLAKEAQDGDEKPSPETVSPADGAARKTKPQATAPQRITSSEQGTTNKNVDVANEEASANAPIASENLTEPKVSVSQDEASVEQSLEAEIVPASNEETTTSEDEVRIAKHLRSTRNKDARQTDDEANEPAVDAAATIEQPTEMAAVEVVASAPARESNRKSTERSSAENLKAASVSPAAKNAAPPIEAPHDAAKGATEALKNTPVSPELPTATQAAESGAKQADDKSATSAATRANTAANALFGHGSSQRPQASGKMEAPSEAVQTRVVQRVARAFEIARSRGDDTLRIRLSPPELGALKLEIRIDGGVMTAKIEAENSLARDVLVDNLGALRQRLAEQNIRVEQFDIGLADRRAGQDFSQSDRQDLPNDRQERNTIGKNEETSNIDRNGKDAARVTIAKGEHDTRLDVII